MNDRKASRQFQALRASERHSSKGLPTIDLKSKMQSLSGPEKLKESALVEIIHLHECLRGALKALVEDVDQLQTLTDASEFCQEKVKTFQTKVSNRFETIWSVFRAHSSAEDEYIWPTLRSKTVAAATDEKVCTTVPLCSERLDQEKYEVDHAVEDEMFTKIANRLSAMQRALESPELVLNRLELSSTAKDINRWTRTLRKHLEMHWQLEEEQCLPLVMKYLSRTEINDLVGKVMGKRSSATLDNIMTMAMQNLKEVDRMEMITCLREALSETFFDSWLKMSGWTCFQLDGAARERNDSLVTQTESLDESSRGADRKRRREECTRGFDEGIQVTKRSFQRRGSDIIRPGQLDKFIHAISSNPALSIRQKQTIIQGLKDSVSLSNQRKMPGNASAEKLTPHGGNAL